MDFRTDKEKAELREIQRDTHMAIYGVLKELQGDYKGEFLGGYLTAVDRILSMTNGDLDKFRQYKT